jgi:hypothetical protein
MPVHAARATIQAPIRSVRLQRSLIAPFSRERFNNLIGSLIGAERGYLEIVTEPQ